MGTNGQRSSTVQAPDIKLDGEDENVFFLTIYTCIIYFLSMSLKYKRSCKNAYKCVMYCTSSMFDVIQGEVLVFDQ